MELISLDQAVVNAVNYILGSDLDFESDPELFTVSVIEHITALCGSGDIELSDCPININETDISYELPVAYIARKSLALLERKSAIGDNEDVLNKFLNYLSKDDDLDFVEGDFEGTLKLLDEDKESVMRFIGSIYAEDRIPTVDMVRKAFESTPITKEMIREILIENYTISKEGDIILKR